MVRAGKRGILEKMEYCAYNQYMLQDQRQLTGKQKDFVRHYVKTKNGTQSALQAYETTDPKVASVIATENLAKPIIKKTIEEYFELEGYSPQDSIRRINATANAGVAVKATANDQLKADELLLKLSGHMVDKRQSTNLNINVESLEKSELIKLKNKYDKLLGKTST